MVGELVSRYESTQNDAEIAGSIDFSERIVNHLHANSHYSAASIFKLIPDIQDKPYHDQEAILRENIAQLNDVERAEFAKARLILNLLNTAMPIIQNIDNQQKPDQNGHHLPSMISLAKTAGYSARDMEQFLNTVRIWKSITPHPTEHLNKLGRDLYRELMHAAELPEEDRAAHIISIADKMLSADITPLGKASMEEETNDAVEQSIVHRQGLRQVYRDLKMSLQESYGEEGPNMPDLLGPRIRMDMALRIWHAGDADGKPNADRWAMMGAMVKLASEAVQDHLNDIQQAVHYELGLDENADITPEALFDLVEDMNLSRNDKDRLRSNIKQLSTTLNALLQIDGQCTAPDDAKPDYEELKARFSKLPIGSTQSREMCRDLNDLQSRFQSTRVKEILQESVFLLRMHGFASAKIETRHNGDVYDTIMDNLFSHGEFLKAANIDVKLQQNISAAGGFSNLDMATQRELMAQAQERLTPRALKEFLFAANPDARAPDDMFVPQNHEFLQRFRLMADHPHMFGMALIAEANDMSSEYQQFFSDVYGVRNIINTPLPEEKETLESVSDAIVEYDNNGGFRNISKRMANAWFRKDRENFHGLIIPCSDSTKQLGVFAKYQLREAITKVADWAFENGKAVLTKEGNGGAIGRGAGTGKTFYRYIMQALKRNADDRGVPLNRHNPKDAVILEHASFMSNTVQGRFFRMLSATPFQVGCDLQSHIGEMLGCRMELEGLVKDHTFIAAYDNFSDDLQVEVDDAHHQMMQYRGLRQVQNENGVNVIDSLADTVSNMDVAGAANSGARPDSKNKKAKEFTKQRAIGSNIICDHMRNMIDCSMMNGRFWENRYNSLLSGNITQDQVDELLGSAFWHDHLQTVTMSLAQVDPVHSASRLGMDDWDHHDMMALANSVETIEVEEGQYTLQYDGAEDGVSPEQAMNALIYADQFKSALIVEALLSVPVENLPEINALLDAEAPERGGPLQKVELGANTQNYWEMARIMRQAANEQLPERVLSDLTQEAINGGAEMSQKQLRLISSAQRSTTAKHAPIYLDQEHAFGHVRKPEWALENILTTHVDQHVELASSIS